jgi:hypothetical protein
MPARGRPSQVRMISRTLRVLAFAIGLTAVSAGAQSLPEWAAPSGGEEPSNLGGGPCGPAPCPPPPPPPVPVDGGIGLLAIAGAGLAAHHLRKRARRGEQ